MNGKKFLLLTLSLTLVATQMVANGGFAEGSKNTVVNPLVPTTVEAQIIPTEPPIGVLAPLPNDIADYDKKGYGKYELLPGLPIVQGTELMPKDYVPPQNQGTSIFKFFTMSDIHITDIQSPSQVLYYGEIATQGMSSAYSGSILYTTQVFDTAIRTVNKMNSNPNTQLDFGIMLGDAVNNAQRNELQMYLDVLAGKQIKPNSNLKKNFNTDYTKTFQAEGLKTPWYQVLGNHDHFWQGTYGGSEKVKKALVGDTMMRISEVRNSKETEGEAIYGGIIDASTPLGKIVGSGKSNGHDSDTHKLPANPERKFLEAKDFVSMIPNGHGLKIDANNPLACYTFEPKANVPLRVIVLDNTAKQDEIFLDNEKGQPVTTAALATLSFEKLKWLKTELDRAQRDKKLIVVATHIPTNMPGIWSKTSEVSETEFIDTLRSYPNMTLLLAGHRHLNTVVAYPTKDASKPELGFWQVETASLRDFPQQFRVFKFNLNDDGTLSIIATDVDPIVTKGSLMEISRKYAIAASQIFPEPKGIVIPKEKSRAYNAELYKKLTPEMVELISKIKK